MSFGKREGDQWHRIPRRDYPLLSWYPLFFVLLCLFLLPIPAYAQEPGPTTWEWRTFNSENSPLAPGGVNVFLEDSQGRIWVGTSRGLSLYQAGEWQTFTAIPATIRRQVRETAKGRCAYCRTPEALTVTTFEIDHIVPTSAGSEDATHIIGLTPTGRATVEALQMNRLRMVRLRHLWLRMGKHPQETETV